MRDAGFWMNELDADRSNGIHAAEFEVAISRSGWQQHFHNIEIRRSQLRQILGDSPVACYPSKIQDYPDFGIMEYSTFTTRLS